MRKPYPVDMYFKGEKNCLRSKSYSPIIYPKCWNLDSEPLERPKDLNIRKWILPLYNEILDWDDIFLMSKQKFKIRLKKKKNCLCIITVHIEKEITRKFSTRTGSIIYCFSTLK